mmetsp:Transcript_18150/g.38808  ORF Transcript_18150/g.38808 Transcript_18150/m.38808 type:complete len:283 (+) Transcript_18150:1093-1941(+)
MLQLPVVDGDSRLGAEVHEGNTSCGLTRFCLAVNNHRVLSRDRRMDSHDCALGKLPQLVGTASGKAVDLALFNSSIRIGLLLQELHWRSSDFVRLELAIDVKERLHLCSILNVLSDFAQQSSNMILPSALDGTPEVVVVVLPHHVPITSFLESVAEVVRSAEFVTQYLLHHLQSLRIPIRGLLLSFDRLQSLVRCVCLSDESGSSWVLCCENRMLGSGIHCSIPRYIRFVVHCQEVKWTLEGIDSSELAFSFFCIDSALCCPRSRESCFSNSSSDHVCFNSV